MAEVDREMLVAFLIDLRNFVYALLDSYDEIFGEAGALVGAHGTALSRTMGH